VLNPVRGEIWLEGHSMPLRENDGSILWHGVVTDITERKRADNEKRIISDIIKGIVTTPDLYAFLNIVHKAISEIVYSENCFVMLHDPETGIDHYELWVDKYDQVPAAHLSGKGFGSYVLKTGKPLLLTEETTKQMYDAGHAEPIGSESPSWIGVPLRTPSRTIGVLVLQHYEETDAYTLHDMEFLTSVADQIALAIERKKSEEALAKSEEIYRTLFNNAPDGILTAGGDAVVLDANPSLCDMLGYSRDELVGASAAKFIDPDEISRISSALEIIRSGVDYHREWTFRTRAGSALAGDVIAKLMPDKNILAVIRNISESLETQAALRNSEERYRELVENAIDIIYTHDLQGNYTSVNRAAEVITGYTPEESKTLNLKDTVASEYLTKAKEMIAAKLAGKDVTAYELEILAKDGRRVPVEVSTRIIYENDLPVGVQGIARDVSERKRLEDQFRQAQKMEAIGVLAGGIAHDFNNLLTAINGYSQLVLKRMQGDDPLRANVEAIHDAGERAARLTTQLLAFSRKQVLQPIVHNLNRVITDIEKMLERLLRENIVLRVSLDPELANIKADPGQMEQIIMNLVVNARDAMPGGGALTIETKNVYLDSNYARSHIDVSPGKFVNLVVTDTGEGIEEKIQEQIFEPFFTTKVVGKGTGLGLSTVFGIVKQSGGDISVHSELGHGTTFNVYLPSVDEEIQVPRWKGDVREEYPGTETILLVEDDPIVRAFVKDTLAASGYNVLVAENGAAALTVCDKYPQQVHLLLTDVVMPGMSGPELSDAIAKIRPDTKVLFMSGYTDLPFSGTDASFADAAFIEKPFTPDRLARKIRQLLDD
jgi:PAS domain S-box-containing protein